MNDDTTTPKRPNRRPEVEMGWVNQWIALGLVALGVCVCLPAKITQEQRVQTVPFFCVDMPIFAYNFKSQNLSHGNLWDYWTEVTKFLLDVDRSSCYKATHQYCDIATHFKMSGQQMKVARRFCPKIGCHGNVP